MSNLRYDAEMTWMDILKLTLVFAVLSAGCFLTRYLIDSHYVTISFP